MILQLSKIRKHPEVVSKYKTRLVRIFCVKHQMWMMGNLPIQPMKLLCIPVTLEMGLLLVQFYKDESGIEFHFVSDLGEEKPNINDYSEEDIYNCPTVRFDDLSKKYSSAKS